MERLSLCYTPFHAIKNLETEETINLSYVRWFEGFSPHHGHWHPVGGASGGPSSANPDGFGSRSLCTLFKFSYPDVGFLQNHS